MTSFVWIVPVFFLYLLMYVCVLQFVGGMSGAQGKAGVICGSVTVLAEVDRNALMKRLKQGWVNEMVEDLDACIARIRLARTEKKPLALAYLGNIVDLWERLVKEEDMLVELGSDQTSLHNPFGGGYMPVQLSYEEGQHVMKTDPGMLLLYVYFVRVFYSFVCMYVCMMSCSIV